MKMQWFVVGLCTLTLAACSSSSGTPQTPSPTPQTGVGGATLKTGAPTPQSPVNNQQVTTTPIVLVVTNTSPNYTPPAPLQYRFEIYNAANGLVQSALVPAGSGTTSYPLSIDLDGDQPFQWQARAEVQGAFGPWSARASFVSPTTTGYIRGNELYDPLNNGKTVGTIHGPATWIPGVGIRLDTESSYIEYMLPQFLSGGEYSALFTNLSVVSTTEDPKDRLISMREGNAPINDNIYRMTVDKRGNGAIAWRFLTGRNDSGSYIETTSSQRFPFPFHENLTYFVRASWGGGVFHVLFKEGGFDGNTIYDVSRNYDREYTPVPHMIFAGSPYQAGDRGDPSTVAGMVIRQIWVSARPRPSYANK
jgi:hypothetical protein